MQKPQVLKKHWIINKNITEGGVTSAGTCQYFKQEGHEALNCSPEWKPQ